MRADEGEAATRNVPEHPVREDTIGTRSGRSSGSGFRSASLPNAPVAGSSVAFSAGRRPNHHLVRPPITAARPRGSFKKSPIKSLSQAPHFPFTRFRRGFHPRHVPVGSTPRRYRNRPTAAIMPIFSAGYPQPGGIGRYRDCVVIWGRYMVGRVVKLEPHRRVAKIMGSDMKMRV